MSDKPVVIKYWCEVTKYGDVTEERAEVPRAEWDALTADQREEYALNCAIELQNDVCPSGFEVIE